MTIPVKTIVTSVAVGSVGILLFLTSSTNVDPVSKVKLRRIWKLVNLLPTSRDTEDLHSLHEVVLQAELEAFRDSGVVVEAKRRLWDLQVEGSFGGGGGGG